MNVETRHKIFRLALSVPLAACVALCVSVAPDEKAYADYNTFYDENWNPGNDIFTGYGLGLNDSVHGMINMMTASAQAVYLNAQNMDYLINQITNDYVRTIYKTLKHFDYHFYDIQAFLTSQNDYVNIGGQPMGSAANVHTLHYYLNNGLNNLVYIYSDTNMMRQFLTSQSNAFVSGGTSYKTLKYYLDLYVNENVSMVTYLNEMKDDIATGTTYLQNIMSDVDFIGGFLIGDTVLVNGDSTYTPYYYLKQIYKTLGTGNYSLNQLLGSMNNRMYANNSTIAELTSNIVQSIGYSNAGWSNVLDSSSPLNTFRQSWNGFIALVIEKLNSLNGYVDGLELSLQTIAERLSYETVTVNGNSVYTPLGYLRNIETGINRLHSDFGTLGNTITTKIDQILQLMTMPNQSAADALIGNFDTDAFDNNMEELNEEIAGIGVFGSIAVLGTYIEIMTDVDELEEPQMVVPFQFGGFQNQSVVVDMTWLDGLKPAINYFLMFMLVMGLTYMTWEAVKMT